ncbi:hypothetical protein [Streptomyces spectabilis]|uniref:Uncharacterized protein n=1 Tax=Streptomyces spectabilis TaxID=68270 RepID=A0A516RFX2_STRST|nr:hypothetical protein [Streptomyces spectabilis]QDQ14545.1 hypothetical protein FH965_31625 [Streptomyces spectabilis]
MFETQFDRVGTVLAARLAVTRYAPMALLSVRPGWDERLPDGYRSALTDALEWDVRVCDSGEVAALEAVVDEALDLEDEEPMGRLYYPYQAAAIISHCCWGLGEGLEHPRFVPRLREEAERYARHVDHALMASAPQPEHASSRQVGRFAQLESDLWQRQAVASGESAAALADFSCDVSAQYMAVLASLEGAGTAH